MTEGVGQMLSNLKNIFSGVFDAKSLENNGELPGFAGVDPQGPAIDRQGERF
jgi:hypothetical protein